MSLFAGLAVLIANSVFMLEEIPVRAGEEGAALISMWPALVSPISTFLISIRFLTKSAE